MPRPRTGKPTGRPQAGGKRWGRRFPPRRKVCFYCVNKKVEIDYKNTERLQNYVSDRGKIEPRRRTGVCAKHQRSVSQAIKRARHLALLPYVSAHVRHIRTVEPQVSTRTDAES